MPCTEDHQNLGLNLKTRSITLQATPVAFMTDKRAIAECRQACQVCLRVCLIRRWST